MNEYEAALVKACREWRDYMFKQMPREQCMIRAQNPGTNKIIAALDLYDALQEVPMDK